MWRVCIVGAGKVGRMIGVMLRQSNNYQVAFADSDAKALQNPEVTGFEAFQVDVSDVAVLTGRLKGFDAVISAAPYFLTPAIAAAAKAAGTHYFDLTEDVASTNAVRELASDAETVFAPQCGLAPGFVGIAGNHLARQFDTIETLSLRVGALPLYPTNALKYNLTWSTDGLINEYCNPCDAIVDGKRTKTAPLENLETISFDGVDYECFNTSGGLGTLSETLSGKANSVSYRTIRYPGHRNIIKMLLHDLNLIKRRDVLKEVFETALPRTDQDVVIVFCTATGTISGEFRERSFINKSAAQTIGGRRWSAIQVTTAAGVTGVVDLVRTGKLTQKGFLAQEEVDLEAFLATEFGNYYRAGDMSERGSMAA